MTWKSVTYVRAHLLPMSSAFTEANPPYQGETNQLELELVTRTAAKQQSSIFNLLSSLKKALPPFF